MGIEFVAGSEVPVLAMSMKWLRDNGPRDLFMGNTYAMKPRMSTDDLRLYAEDIRVFLQSLQYHTILMMRIRMINSSVTMYRSIALRIRNSKSFKLC